MADINIGAILEALNDKADIGLSNVGEVANALKFLDGLLAKRTTDDSFLQFFGGTSYNKGAYIRADGESGPLAGGFRIAACNSANGTKSLEGKPDGKLQWNGYEVVRQQNYNKTAYIRFNNGMTLAWGITGGSASLHTISLPITFSSGDTYAVYTNPFNNGGPFYAPAFYEKTGTYFKIRTAGNAESVQIAWLVVGSN